MPKQHSAKETSKKSANKTAKKTLRIMLLSLFWIIIVGIIGAFFAGGVAVGYFVSLVHDDQVRHRDFIEKKIQENETTGFVYFNDDTLVGQLRTDQDRRLVQLSDIPQNIKDAFIATEDRNFYKHYGIDLYGF
ncbi:MAG TPA: transglycosylase domain-containing protein, partial [Bacilli bacterium]